MTAARMFLYNADLEPISETVVPNLDRSLEDLLERYARESGKWNLVWIWSGSNERGWVTLDLVALAEVDLDGVPDVFLEVRYQPI